MTTNIEYAFKALDFVRSRIPQNMSDNKRWKRETAMETFQRNNLNYEIGNLRTHPSNPGFAPATLLNIVKYGQRVIIEGKGNCMEVSCAVANYLSTQLGFYYFDLVRFSQCDHVFVAIGQPYNNGYPTNFSQWSQTAAICDVWADIACQAVDYPARWRARMQNWDTMGRTPAGPHGAATGDYWYNAVDNDKLSFSVV